MEEEDELYRPRLTPSRDDFWRDRDGGLPSAKLPKLEDHKPMIGPTIEGQIRVQYKAAIDGYLTTSEDAAKMAELGLPTGFVFGSLDSDSHLRQKKQKKTYYCDLCLLELNSEDTMKAHMAGQKHMKKNIAAQQQKIDQQSKVEIPSIRPILNPVAIRKKVPIRLQQKISDSPLPIVGLSHIREYIACSNSEMEPHYECGLCGTQGQANCMFQHLVGAKHRQAAVDEFYNNDPEKIALSQAQLLQFAQENNENDERISERINSKYSDDEYPWPAGMEPWLIERGGSGIIPDGARCNFGKNMPKPSQNRNFLVEDKKPRVVASSSICGISPIPSKSSCFQTSIKDVQPSDIKAPRSKDEALKMIMTGRDLLLKAMEFNKAKSEELHLISSATNLIKTKVVQGSSRKQMYRRSPSHSSRSSNSSSSSVDTSRERSTSRNYDSRKRRREDRRHQDEGSYSRDRRRESLDQVKKEPRWYEYRENHERRRGSYRDDDRRDYR